MPPVRDVVRLTAQLGGFLARGDGEPGVSSQQRWRLSDFALTVKHLQAHQVAS